MTGLHNRVTSNMEPEFYHEDLKIDMSDPVSRIEQRQRALFNSSSRADQYDEAARRSDDESDWHRLRISRIRSLWIHLLITLFVIAVWTGLERQPICLVTEHPSDWPSCRPVPSPAQKEQDYGLFYRAAYAVSFAYMCLSIPAFMAIYDAWNIPMSLFRSPSSMSSESGQGVFSSVQREVLKRIESWLMMVNRVVFSVMIVVMMACFLCFLFAVLWYKEEVVDLFQRNDSRRTLWKERALLITAAAATVLVGLYVQWIVDMAQIGRVKPLEYWLIILPAQVVVGIVLATKLQRRWERRQNKRGIQ